MKIKNFIDFINENQNIHTDSKQRLYNLIESLCDFDENFTFYLKDKEHTRYTSKTQDFNKYRYPEQKIEILLKEIKNLKYENRYVIESTKIGYCIEEFLCKEAQDECIEALLKDEKLIKYLRDINNSSNGFGIRFKNTFAINLISLFKFMENYVKENNL